MTKKLLLARDATDYDKIRTIPLASGVQNLEGKLRRRA